MWCLYLGVCRVGEGHLLDARFEACFMLGGGGVYDIVSLAPWLWNVTDSGSGFYCGAGFAINPSGSKSGCLREGWSQREFKIKE